MTLPNCLGYENILLAQITHIKSLIKVFSDSNKLSNKL